MSAITSERISQRRKNATHCKHGHEYTPKNVRMVGGSRVCITCSKEQAKVRMARFKAAAGTTELQQAISERQKLATAYFADMTNETKRQAWIEAKQRVEELRAGEFK